MVLKLGLPAGSLQEQTLEIFRRAGWEIRASSRSYYPASNDPELEVVLFRAQEMSRYVERGFLDAGLTGRDWVQENASRVVVVTELNYSKASLAPVRWVLAVPESSPIQSVQDLQGKRIATELVNGTRRFLQERGVEAEVEFSWGATEVKAGAVVEAIVELTETGSSLRAHHLRVLDTVMESRTLLIANSESWQEASKRRKIESLGLLLQGAITAREKVGLKLNVSRQALERVLALLPALRRPTVSELSESGWLAVETVIDEARVRELIPQLKAAGADGLIEYPLNKVIP